MTTREKAWSDEYRFGPVDGPYRTYLDRGLIARDSEARAYRMIGSMFDVTEQRRTEEALRESEARFRQLVTVLEAERGTLRAVIKNLPVGVGIGDKHGTTLP